MQHVEKIVIRSGKRDKLNGFEHVRCVSVHARLVRLDWRAGIRALVVGNERFAASGLPEVADGGAKCDIPISAPIPDGY